MLIKEREDLLSFYSSNLTFRDDQDYHKDSSKLQLLN